MSCQLRAITQIQKWWFDILWMIFLRLLWWQLIVVLFSNCRCEHVFAISLILKCHLDLMKLQRDLWLLIINIWIQRWHFDIFWVNDFHKVMITLNFSCYVQIVILDISLQCHPYVMMVWYLPQGGKGTTKTWTFHQSHEANWLKRREVKKI